MMCLAAEITVAHLTPKGIVCAKCLYLAQDKKAYEPSIGITTGNKSEFIEIKCDKCGVKV
jgi:hypothetical protein